MIINPYRYAAASGNLLLDETNLGSAHVAYSVARKLRDAYSGSAIRVRRSSDNAEQDIGFISNALDESSLTTFVGANDGHIVTLYDQSGNGYNATQAEISFQARIVISGAVTKDNGKPALEVTTSMKYKYTGGGISSQSTATLMMVAETGASDGTSELKSAFSVGSSASYGQPVLGWGEYGVSEAVRKPAAGMYGGQSTVSSLENTNQVLMISVTNGTDLGFYENDITELTRTYGTSLSIVDNSVYILEQSNAFPMGDDYWQEGVIWLADKDAYVSIIKSNVNGFYGIY